MHMDMLDMPLASFFVSSNYAVLHPDFLHARVHPIHTLPFTHYPYTTILCLLAFSRLFYVRVPFAYDVKYFSGERICQKAALAHSCTSARRKYAVVLGI